MIRFNSKTEIVISEDLSKDVLSILNEEKIRNIGIIVDSNVVSNFHVGRLIPTLQQNFKTLVNTIGISEPSTEMVNVVTEKFKGEQLDFLIGIGGGSTLDLTKAVSAMCVNPGNVEDYHGTDKPIIAALPKMLIPTTAGTGSEVTPGAVLVNNKTKFKRGLSAKCISADYALLNAKLTIDMPVKVAASTGMDAIAHAVESFTAKSSNNITKMYSREAFALTFNNLPLIFAKETDSIDVRKKIQLGACLAGYAIFNSNTGACHALSYPLGIFRKIPHGIAVGLILPEVIKINVEKGCYDYSELYDIVEGRDSSMTDPAEKSLCFANMLQEYCPIKFMDSYIRDFGVDESNYEFLAERGLDLVSALSNNPVHFSYDDALRVFERLLYL